MSRIKQNWVNILILCIIALGAWARATVYGDLRLSIGMPDTGSYVSSSAPSLLSWDAFTGRRLFTMNLLYKAANNKSLCELTVISDPAIGEEGFRQIQPCFERIAVVQNVLSIVSWSLLAWLTSRWLKHAPYKIAAVILILLFGFTPQIAEWDSALSSESLSVSLFVIALAVLMEITFRLTEKDGESNSTRTTTLIFTWLVVFSLWVFVRDVHVYAIPVTLLGVIPLLFIIKSRLRKTIIAVMLILMGMFIIGSISSKQSPRWQPSFFHVFDQYIAAYPARLEFFRKQGMPADRTSDAYDIWLNEHAPKSYARFIISHPGFVVSTLLERQAYFRSDFIQPYFTIPELKYRETFITIGEIFHPETNAIYLLDTLLLISLCISAIRYRSERTIGWAWLSLWVFLYASLSLFVSYFGDIDGTRRHIFPSVEVFRLFCWMFLIVHMDLLTDPFRKSAHAQLDDVEA